MSRMQIFRASRSASFSDRVSRELQALNASQSRRYRPLKTIMRFPTRGSRTVIIDSQNDTIASGNKLGCSESMILPKGLVFRATLVLACDWMTQFCLREYARCRIRGRQSGFAFLCLRNRSVSLSTHFQTQGNSTLLLEMLWGGHARRIR